MASFVVLTPPEDDDSNERAVFIRDGFSLIALLFHLFWLLWHRLWFAAALLFLVFVGLTAAVEAWPQWSLFSSVAWLLVVWFIALEGNAMRIAKKERQDWQITAIVEAQNRETAEEIFYAGQRSSASMRKPSDRGKAMLPGPHAGGTRESGSTLGLLGFQERHG